MTPEIKAKDLVNKFYHSDKAVMGGFGIVPESYYESAKQCALICVDEILKALYEVEYWEKDSAIKICKHYKEVKIEINKL